VATGFKKKEQFFKNYVYCRSRANSHEGGMFGLARSGGWRNAKWFHPEAIITFAYVGGAQSRLDKHYLSALVRSQDLSSDTSLQN
jgi:hypothetical protein